MEDKQIPQLLKEIRKKWRFSQEDLAETIGVSRQTISNWETGKSKPDYFNWQSIERLYGLEELENKQEVPHSLEKSLDHGVSYSRLERLVLFVLAVACVFIPGLPWLVLYLLMRRKASFSKGFYRLLFGLLACFSLLHLYVFLVMFYHVFIQNWLA